MTTPFFSRRVPFFGNRAMLILCAIFFLLPFVIRGARLGIDSMENKVADWLPASFPETKELRRFRDHFIGDQFVVLSWDGCNESDPAFTNLVRKIRAESLDATGLSEEEILAHLEGDKYGWHTTGNYHEDWGHNNEKWFIGNDKIWYFINRNGEVFKWDGQANIVEAIGRSLERFFKGTNVASGKFIGQFGEPQDNEFYRDPSKLFARFFKGVTTGPQIFAEMAGDGGTMRVGKWTDADEASFEAMIETHKRLTGILFGPTPNPEFQWTFESFLSILPEDKLPLIDEDRQFVFEQYVQKELIDKLYGGQREKLLTATPDTKLEHWYRLWDRLQLEPPPRQTCLIVTLNDPVIWELARAVGRPVLGKPRGRILELATGQCGIEPENLHIGGPPVDNVAIDEEGSITLFRLVGFAGVIGITLAYLSFRSLRITFMIFFVGGISALASLSFVYFGGSTMDAILMSMPSLVYVLGLSSAVHVVNYYRDSCYENGPVGAPETAFRLGWFPCTLAAFTTALGLISLYTSGLTPIKKFGLFSAIATMATVVLLFSYIPSALTIWPPGYKRREPEAHRDGRRRFNLAKAISGFWQRVGATVIRYHWAVVVGGLLVIIVFGYGVSKIETSIQLLKLFRSDAKILQDYRWMEENLGKLVPMELVMTVDKDAKVNPSAKGNGGPVADGQDSAVIPADQRLAYELKYSVLERMELSARVRKQVLHVFGPGGANIIGSSMSTDVVVPLDIVVDNPAKGSISRMTINGEFQAKYADLIQLGYLRLERPRESEAPYGIAETEDLENRNEMWRVSLRLAALNNVDYGAFVNELKTVVEPIMQAYRFRHRLIKTLQAQLGAKSLNQGRVLVLGTVPKVSNGSEAAQADPHSQIDQTRIFAETLSDLLQNSGFRPAQGRDIAGKGFMWLEAERVMSSADKETLLGFFDCIVLVDQCDQVAPLVAETGKPYIDARQHLFEIDPATKLPLAGMKTAFDLKQAGDPDVVITTAYTGIVPIVYKAQRELLQSLIQSIGLAFVMISLVMMLLLRNWRRPPVPTNLVNVPGGLVAMLPNIFPIVLVFGAMGHLGVLVDIGSMMTASVAMGVAVDDTIHYLNWYRKGLSQGKSRIESIQMAYDKCATAMTQTTLIGGLGLSAFAFSTFMPTQRFGVLMLLLLAAALIGDLILLPALLASPLGRFFGSPNKTPAALAADPQHGQAEPADAANPAFAADAENGRSAVKAPHMSRKPASGETSNLRRPDG